MPQDSKINENNRYSEDVSEEKKKYFLSKKNSVNDEWLSKMPNHQMHELPECFTKIKQRSQREAYISKLKSLLKLKCSLSIIADILLYNDYESIDNILNERKSFFNKAREIDSHFALSLKKVKGPRSSSLCADQVNRINALLDLIIRGDYINNSDSINELQDMISVVVDSPKFNEACLIENEFLNEEIDRLMKMISDDDKRRLENLIQKSTELQNKLIDSIEIYKKIEEVVNSRNSELR